jgi:hypothetical protein
MLAKVETKSRTSIFGGASKYGGILGGSGGQHLFPEGPAAFLSLLLLPEIATIGLGKRLFLSRVALGFTAMREVV